MVEAGGRQRLSVRWLLLPWVALLVLSIALPLLAGAGVGGLLGFVPLHYEDNPAIARHITTGASTSTPRWCRSCSTGRVCA